MDLNNAQFKKQYELIEIVGQVKIQGFCHLNWQGRSLIGKS